MKPSSEYEDFDRAMGEILKADPAKVKEQMEAEKKERGKIGLSDHVKSGHA
jgi:hypothetical protein